MIPSIRSLIILLALLCGPLFSTIPAGLYADFDTSLGHFTCELYAKDVPQTVGNFVALATGTQERTPLYNNVLFHRVIPHFMIQGGDPTGTGRGGPGYRFADEFKPSLQFDKPGTLAMANSGPNTNGSQFFVTTVATPWLNNHHTIFGRVVDGMDIVLQISNVERNAQDRPLKDIVIKKITISEVK